MAKVRIDRFLAAMREHPEAATDLTDFTWKRWVSGGFPKNLHWLLRSPEVMKALADDASDWTDDEWATIEGAAQERSDTQKAWREGKPRRPRGRPKGTTKE